MQSAVDKMEKGIQSLPCHLSLWCEKNGFALTSRLLRKIDVDAPLTLSFIFLCCLIEALKSLVGNEVIYSYFAVSSWSHFVASSARCWGNLVSQVLGHSNHQHLFGNVSITVNWSHQ